VVTSVFETVLTVIKFLLPSPAENAKVQTVQNALGPCRILLAISMVAIFMYAVRETKDDSEASIGERQSLLGNGTLRTEEPYGGANGKAVLFGEKKVVDAQSSGWLDYFVGFRVLFPYIW
jgi:hypothetical protein